MIVTGRRVTREEGIDQRQAVRRDRGDDSGVLDGIEHGQWLVDTAGVTEIGKAIGDNAPP